MRKVVLIIFLCVVAYVLFTFGAQFVSKKMAEPPDIKTAPYQVNTASRVYFAASYNVTDNITVMKDWWEESGGRWVFHKGLSPEMDKYFGKVTVDRRAGK